MLYVADDLSGPMPIGQVRLKSYLPEGKSSCPGQVDVTFLSPGDGKGIALMPAIHSAWGVHY